jgi:hypothetical protein
MPSEGSNPPAARIASLQRELASLLRRAYADQRCNDPAFAADSQRIHDLRVLIKSIDPNASLLWGYF